MSALISRGLCTVPVPGTSYIYRECMILLLSFVCLGTNGINIGARLGVAELSSLSLQDFYSFISLL